MPDADLDDPAVRVALRRLSLPMHGPGRGAPPERTTRLRSRAGYRAGARMIVQGQDDPLVRPHLTRQLAGRLPNLAGYLEAPGQHEIVRGATLVWNEISDAVRRFLAGNCGG